MNRIIFAFLAIFLACHSSAQPQQNVRSELVLLNVKSGKEKVILSESRHFEAPNWSRDGRFLIINADGFLEKISPDGKNMGKIMPDKINNCNNDHGLTFDGKTLIFSRNEVELGDGANSRIYVVPMAGGTPKLVTELMGSYWHGVSPDGQSLVYCAGRGDAWDVYKIGIRGGSEIRLTDANGLDDGPEYSYDGQWIYFNSHRTGRMHVYRMKPDGSAQEQLTNDAYDNWFPHPSPDGNSIVFISYIEDQKGAHPFGRDVKLRLMNLKTRKIRDLTPVFFGGQGSVNVPSWSADGEWIAFVRYKIEIPPPQPFVLGVTEQIRSHILSENRTLNVYLPEGYNAADTVKYPVIYLLDGAADEDFIHVVGIVQFNTFSWINQIPKSIVVGIGNTDRRRDFAFPSTLGSEKKRFPTAGGSANFMAFIERELMPHIENKYRVNSAHKTIIGQSLGGLLATEILLKKPALFNKYIIVSPSIWWDNGSILNLQSEILESAYFRQTDIYIGVGKEGLAPSETPHVMEVDANLLAEKLKATKSKSVSVYFDYLPEENHATISHQAVFNAFRILHKK